MPHKENRLDGKRKKGDDKKKEKTDRNGKYNRRKIESKIGMVEPESFVPGIVGKPSKKKGIQVLEN